MRRDLNTQIKRLKQQPIQDNTDKN